MRVRRVIAWTTGLLFGCAALAWGLVVARDVLVLIYLSGLIAVGLGPLVAALERRPLLGRRTRLSRLWATVIAYLFLTALLAAVTLLVLPTLVGQASELAAMMPKSWADAQAWLVRHGILRRQVTVQDMVQQTPGATTDVVGVVLGTVWGLVGGVAGLVTIAVLSFYLVVEADAIMLTFVRLFPRARRMRVRIVVQKIGNQVSAWLGGQLLLSAIIGITAALGLFALGLPYFYVLALLAAVGELVPYLGPIAAAVPALVVAARVSWELTAAVAVFYVIQQQLENNVIIPRVMERQLGLSAATIIVAALLGGSLLGLTGIVLAVPTAAIVQVLVQELVPAMDGDQP